MGTQAHDDDIMAEGELRGSTALASAEVLDELVRSSTESELDDAGLDDRHQTVLAPVGYHHQIVTPPADLAPPLAVVPRATPSVSQPVVEPPPARGSLREMRAVPLDEVLEDLDDGDRSMSIADLAALDDEERANEAAAAIEAAAEQQVAPVLPVQRSGRAWRWLAAVALVAGAALAAYVAM